MMSKLFKAGAASLVALVATLVLAQTPQRTTIPRLVVTEELKIPATTDCNRLSQQQVGSLCFDSDADPDSDGTVGGLYFCAAVNSNGRCGSWGFAAMDIDFDDDGTADRANFATALDADGDGTNPYVSSSGAIIYLDPDDDGIAEAYFDGSFAFDNNADGISTILSEVAMGSAGLQVNGEVGTTGLSSTGTIVLDADNDGFAEITIDTATPKIDLDVNSDGVCDVRIPAAGSWDISCDGIPDSGGGTQLDMDGDHVPEASLNGTAIEFDPNEDTEVDVSMDPDSINMAANSDYVAWPNGGWFMRNSASVCFDYTFDGNADVCLLDGGIDADVDGAVDPTGGGGTAAVNYSASFSATTTVTLTHNLGTRNVLVACYDTSTTPDVKFEPGGVTVAEAAPYNVVVTWTGNKTGFCVVNGAGASRYMKTLSPAGTSFTVTGATHGLGTSAIRVTCYDDASPANMVEPNTVSVNTTTFDTVITFTEAQAGYCVLQ